MMSTERDIASVHNYRETEGDTFADDLEFTDRLTGDPIDLTGISGAALVVSKDFDDTSPALWSATQSGGEITIPTPANGVVLIRKSIDLAPGEYVYNYSHTVGGVLRTYMRGSFSVRARSGPTP